MHERTTNLTKSKKEQETQPQKNTLSCQLRQFHPYGILPNEGCRWIF